LAFKGRKRILNLKIMQNKTKNKLAAITATLAAAIGVLAMVPFSASAASTYYKEIQTGPGYYSIQRQYQSQYQNHVTATASNYTRYGDRTNGYNYASNYNTYSNNGQNAYYRNYSNINGNSSTIIGGYNSGYNNGCYGYKYQNSPSYYLSTTQQKYIRQYHNLL